MKVKTKRLDFLVFFVFFVPFGVHAFDFSADTLPRFE